jgi:hypothetical protein
MPRVLAKIEHDPDETGLFVLLHYLVNDAQKIGVKPYIFVIIHN